MGFPRLRLEGIGLYRIHSARRHPWWFSQDGSGRFDLPASGPYGTCYWAREPLGCFLEVFRYSHLVPEQEIVARRIARVEMPGLEVADCTSGLSRRFGLTGEIHSTPNYSITQAWARAFQEAGFDGIQYLLRHDPGQKLRGIALFGPAGSPPWPIGSTEPIDTKILKEAEHLFGIQRLQVPPPE